MVSEEFTIGSFIVTFLGVLTAMVFQKWSNDGVKKAQIMSPTPQTIPINTAYAMMDKLSNGITIGLSKLIPDKYERMLGLQPYIDKQEAELKEKGEDKKPQPPSSQRVLVENMTKEALDKELSPENIQARLNEFVSTTQFELITMVTENSTMIKKLSKSVDMLLEKVEQYHKPEETKDLEEKTKPDTTTDTFDISEFAEGVKQHE